MTKRPYTPPEQIEMLLQPPESRPSPIMQGNSHDTKLMVNEELNSAHTQLKNKIQHITRIRSEISVRFSEEEFKQIGEFLKGLNHVDELIDEIVNVESRNPNARRIHGKPPEHEDKDMEWLLKIKSSREQRAARFSEITTKADNALKNIQETFLPTTKHVMDAMNSAIEQERNLLELSGESGDAKLTALKARIEQAKQATQDMIEPLNEMKEAAQKQATQLFEQPVGRLR